MPPLELLKDTFPFAVGKDLIIDVKINAKGVTDVYIDDTMALTVDIEGSCSAKRVEQETLLATHCAAREKHKNEPIPREEMAALVKLLAEAGAEEKKVILGWMINFKALTVSLPQNKHNTWKRGIFQVLRTGKTSCKELKQMIGRPVHLGFDLPSVHHFMSRPRELLRRSASRRAISLNASVVADLDLMLFCLDEAKARVDMNIFSYRKPTKVHRSDSCPAGLGGCSSSCFTSRFTPRRGSCSELQTTF